MGLAFCRGLQNDNGSFAGRKLFFLFSFSTICKIQVILLVCKYLKKEIELLTYTIKAKIKVTKTLEIWHSAVSQAAAKLYEEQF
jgi:hypothetical protein